MLSTRRKNFSTKKKWFPLARMKDFVEKYFSARQKKLSLVEISEK